MRLKPNLSFKTVFAVLVGLTFSVSVLATSSEDPYDMDVLDQAVNEFMLEQEALLEKTPLKPTLPLHDVPRPRSRPERAQRASPAPVENSGGRREGGERKVAFIAPVCGLDSVERTSSWSLARKHPVLRNVTRRHDGHDYGISKGTPIYAPCDGVALAPKYDGDGYGHYLDYQCAINGRTYTFRFAHLQSKPKVEEGQRIGQGTRIATTGGTGLRSGYHLHFEVRNAANTVSTNPTPFLEQMGFQDTVMRNFASTPCPSIVRGGGSSYSGSHVATTGAEVPDVRRNTTTRMGRSRQLTPVR